MSAPTQQKKSVEQISPVCDKGTLVKGVEVVAMKSPTPKDLDMSSPLPLQSLGAIRHLEDNYSKSRLDIRMSRLYCQMSWRKLWRTSAKWQKLWRSWRKMKMKCLCNCHSNSRLSFKRLSDKNKVTCVTMTRVCVYTFVKGCVEVMPSVCPSHTNNHTRSYNVNI